MNPQGFFEIRLVIRPRGRKELHSNFSKEKREIFYSLPNLFRSVKPTPKNRTAATGQTDHVILPFCMKSIPRKKMQNIPMKAMPYHHFFSPFPHIASFIILIVSEHVCRPGKKGSGMNGKKDCTGYICTKAFWIRSVRNADGTVPVFA